MSYAEQIGDKFYEINPKDAREGDEIYWSNSQWRKMTSDYITSFNNFTSMMKTMWMDYKRRRLIAPGEAGKENEFAQVLASVPVETKKEVPVDLRDSLIQIHITQNELKIIQADLVKVQRRYEWIIEQPQPTPDPRIQAVIDAARVLVSETSFSGTSWGTNFNALESALAALGEETIKQATYECIVCREDYWDAGKCSYCNKMLTLKLLTPAEAQARMEGKDEFKEWLNQSQYVLPKNDGLTRIAAEQAVKDYIKWHAAKTKGGGE